MTKTIVRTSQARKRLPEKSLQKLFINVGNELESKTTPEDSWCGRHVTTSAFPCAFRRRGVARQSNRMVQQSQCLIQMTTKKLTLNPVLKKQVVAGRGGF
ncbi:MAG: hypothetical protein QNJ41_24340 [Xenococcaceae cyanobacterium MO_188.B32]|nr:hypothetical protein [Xenococcaceae cyanobacterium MO_188.B32]